MNRLVTIASCTLNQWALDFDGNLDRILKSIVEAKETGATFRTGPELEICGYSCEDHFYESDTFLHSWEILAELLTAPLCKDILIDVGMPVMHKNVAYNCRVVFLNKKILLIRPKKALCDDGNYRESRWFTSWKKDMQIEDFYLPVMIANITGQKLVPIGDAVISTLDTCIGFEICEELWLSSSSHIPLSLDGIEIICNGSASYSQLSKGYAAMDLIKSATMKGGGCYVYSNLRGCDGQRVYFEGMSSIILNGHVLSSAKQYALEEVEVITATVDLEDIRSYRNAKKSHANLASGSPSFPRIEVDYSLSSEYDIGLSIAQPVEYVLLTREEKIAKGAACWLWDYLRRSGQGGFFLPLSGGIDSSSAALIVYYMCTLIIESIQKGRDPEVVSNLRRIIGNPGYVPKSAKELCNHLLVTCYMGTENSSEETKQRASDLAAAINSHHINVVIDKAVSAVLEIFRTVTGLFPKFASNGGCRRQNNSLQNIQARLRMVQAYLFAQLMLWARDRPGALLVLGSTNVDEALTGYTTKYDCSSADINPIGGLSKTDIRRFMNYALETFKMPIIRDIIDAPPTAELVPLERGRVVQVDEEDLGLTYAELSEFGRLRKVDNCGPYSMYCKLVRTWSTTLTPEIVAEKIKHFFRCYARKRHKMAVLTPSYHVESYNPDDNRFDLRPLLYRFDWPWQFRAIDTQVGYITAIDKKTQNGLEKE